MADQKTGSFSINYTGDDSSGKYIDLEDSAPYDGITIDEAEGEVTFHD